MSAPIREPSARAGTTVPRETVLSDERVDLYDYFLDLYRRRWLVLAFGLLGALLAGVYLFYAKPVFISTSKILPSAEKGRTSQLSGLAALAGISMPQETSNEALYNEILHSKDFLDTLLAMKWETARSPSEALSLADLWEVRPEPTRADSAAVLRETLMSSLKQRIFFVQNPATGVMQLDVHSDDPVLSQRINAFLLARLDAYNRDVRKSKAGENRKFVAKNAEESRLNLQKAEEDLRRFRELNRTVSTPSLQLDLERRFQEVEINKSIYLELRKQFELAKIEEFKSVNLINILERPVVPVGKAAPRRKIVMAVGLFLGLFAGTLFAALQMAWKSIKRSRS